MTVINCFSREIFAVFGKRHLKYVLTSKVRTDFQLCNTSVNSIIKNYPAAQSSGRNNLPCLLRMKRCILRNTRAEVAEIVRKLRQTEHVAFRLIAESFAVACHYAVCIIAVLQNDKD